MFSLTRVKRFAPGFCVIYKQHHYNAAACLRVLFRSNFAKTSPTTLFYFLRTPDDNTGQVGFQNRWVTTNLTIAVYNFTMSSV